MEDLPEDSETAGILNEIQKMMGELQSDPADFNGRIIFMSMFNDIVWDARGNEELYVAYHFFSEPGPRKDQ